MEVGRTLKRMLESWRSPEATVQSMAALEGAAGMDLKESKENLTGNWRKGDSCYVAVECSATLLPAEIQKVENVLNDLGDGAEISRRW